MPATPVTDTRWVRRSSALAWNRSFSIRISRSRPTNGASSPSLRKPPPTLATTRAARHRRMGSALPFISWFPASSYTIEASVARRVESPTNTCPGPAAAWMRAAVFTRSPATMPWSVAPRVTAASPVSTPALARRSGAPASRPSAPTASVRSIAARTARSASSSWATGVPHTAMTASPMNFSTMPP